MNSLQIILAHKFFSWLVNAGGRTTFSFALAAAPVPQRYRGTRVSHSMKSGRWLFSLVLCLATLHLLTGAQPIAAAADQPPTAKAALYMPKLGSGRVAAAMAAGNSHTCLMRAGAVYCWGLNGAGQLGDGTLLDRLTPVAVTGLNSGVTAITAGFDHSCAIVGGGVYCWGDNTYGEVGDGTMIDSPTPVAVAELGSGVIALSAGDSHTCALLSGRAVKCWGYNESGQLGDSTITYRTSPVDVAGVGDGVIALAGGWGHSCVMSNSGAKCWGKNLKGQLGDGTTTFHATPTTVLFD